MHLKNYWTRAIVVLEQRPRRGRSNLERTAGMTKQRYDDHEGTQRYGSPSKARGYGEGAVPAEATGGFAPIAPLDERSPVKSVGLPIAHVTDGQTDVEILRSVPKQFAITDDKTANWLVKRVQQSRHYAERVKEWAELELRRAAREEATLMWVYGRQLEQWARDEIAKFNGRRKSLALPAATIGFRTNAPKLVVDDEAVVLAWARHNLPAAVVTTEKLAKSVLNEYAERTGEIPDGGVHVEPAIEKFYIR